LPSKRANFIFLSFGIFATLVNYVIFTCLFFLTIGRTRILRQHLSDKRLQMRITLLLREVLAQDPRPAYRKEEEAGKNYAVWLLDFNVRWA
jgi:hypothetical protein